MTKLDLARFAAILAAGALGACHGGQGGSSQARSQGGAPPGGADAASAASTASAASGGHANASNPLLGKWQLSGCEVNGATPGVRCASAMAFDEHQLTVTEGDGTQSTGAVESYVYVPGSDTEFILQSGGHITYKLLGPDDMELDSGYANERYHRVG